MCKVGAKNANGCIIKKGGVNMKFKNENNKLVDFTADNFTNFLENITNKEQIPYTKEEAKEIIIRYKKQLNRTVQVYYDGKRNIIKFID